MDLEKRNLSFLRDNTRTNIGNLIAAAYKQLRKLLELMLVGSWGGFTIPSVMDREKFNIIPLRDNARDCFEDIIASFCKWLGRDYELMFTKSLAFSFEPQTMSSTKSICGRMEFYMQYMLQKLEALFHYHGIRIEEIKCESFREQMKFIDRELREGRPVVAYNRAFWIPWDPGYRRKGHQGIHAFLIVGYSAEKKCLYCVDTTYMKQWEPLPLHLYRKGSLDILYKFSVVQDEKREISLPEILERMLQGIQNNGQYKTIADLKLFCDELETGLDFKKETEGYQEFFRAPLFIQIQYLALGRRKAGRLLEYLAKRFNIPSLEIIAREFELEGANWENIRASLMKMYYMMNYETFFNKVIGKIHEIIDTEQKLLLQLSELYQDIESRMENSFLPTKPDLKNETIQGEIVFVALEKYFNNNGCGSLNINQCIADFNGLGQFFLLESMPPAELFVAGDMKFWFPRLADETNDNIGAAGEIIPIVPGKYRQIMFLGCADEGNLSGPVIVQYEDGWRETINLEFSCWWMLGFGEAVAWLGKMAERFKNEIFVSVSAVRLFAQKYRLQDDRQLISVQLPDCSSIHIFAISLEE